MSWVRSDSWLTYVALDAPSEAVTYDLSITPDGVMSLSHFGDSPTSRHASANALPGWLPRLPLGAPEALLLLAFALVIAGGWYTLARRGRRPGATGATGAITD